MINIFADLSRKTLLIFFAVFSVGLANVRSQTNALPENWYCDARWQGDIYAATVENVAPYDESKVGAPQAELDKLGAFAAAYKAENVVKFIVEKSYKNNFETGSELEVFNIKTKELPAIKFKVGEKYLIYLETFSFYGRGKTSSGVRFIRPDGRTKLFSENSAVVDFLEKASQINFDKEVLGFDGQAMRIGFLSGKAVSLPKPAYPPQAKKDKAGGTIKVYVLVETDGKVIKAKAVCPLHPSLGEAAETAARAARFSPTMVSGKPVRIRGIIVYNFVP